MIQFEEWHEGYAGRTRQNAKDAWTLAIAADFSTAGERCTRTAAMQLGKGYFALSVDFDWPALDKMLQTWSKSDCQVLNIAGNGLYTLAKLGWTQQRLDAVLVSIMHSMLQIRRPELVRSGGQTGIDEAGLKAASLLGMPAHCLAPKGWQFRTSDGIDRWGKQAFIDRFSNINQ